MSTAAEQVAVVATAEVERLEGVVKQQERALHGLRKANEKLADALVSAQLIASTEVEERATDKKLFTELLRTYDARFNKIDKELRDQRDFTTNNLVQRVELASTDSRVEEVGAVADRCAQSLTAFSSEFDVLVQTVKTWKASHDTESE